MLNTDNGGADRQHALDLLTTQYGGAGSERYRLQALAAGRASRCQEVSDAGRAVPARSRLWLLAVVLVAVVGGLVLAGLWLRGLAPLTSVLAGPAPAGEVAAEPGDVPSVGASDAADASPTHAWAASSEPSAIAAPTGQSTGGAQAALRSGTGSYICSSSGVGVQCWGTKLDKQKVPLAPISGLENVNITALSVGHGFATAVAEDGTVYAWGDNDKGQLGTAAGERSEVAVEVGTLPGKPSQLVTGNEHSCALVGGEVYCYGSNRFGQVTGASTAEPAGVTKVEGVTGAVDLGTSGYDTWAVTPEGTWSWGNNTWGQTSGGEGSSTSSSPSLETDR